MSGCLSCSDAYTCLVCDTANKYILVEGQCICISGYYIDQAGICQTCGSALIGCDICDTDIACLTCFTASYFALQPNLTCACVPMYVPSGNTCISCFVDCVCYGYQWNASHVCTSFCSDSITITPMEQCDDGNFVAGDGCSPTCMT